MELWWSTRSRIKELESDNSRLREKLTEITAKLRKTETFLDTSNKERQQLQAERDVEGQTWIALNRTRAVLTDRVHVITGLFHDYLDRLQILTTDHRHLLDHPTLPPEDNDDES